MIKSLLRSLSSIFRSKQNIKTDENVLLIGLHIRNVSNDVAKKTITQRLTNREPGVKLIDLYPHFVGNIKHDLYKDNY